MAKVDLSELLEVAYRVDSATYLEDVMQAAVPVLDRGSGLCGFYYDASRPNDLRLGEIVEVGAPGAISVTAHARSVLMQVDAEFVKRTYRQTLVGTASDQPNFKG